MAVLVMQCPHCGAENMTFEVMQAVGHLVPGKASVVALCAGCDEPVLASFRTEAAQADYILNTRGNLLSARGFASLGIWPSKQSLNIPESLPERVAKNFMEALKIRNAKHWNAACGSYRRCLEIALKEFAPEIEARMLEKRIDKLAAEQRITPALQAWAHELRLDGNEALHGLEDATEEMAEQMHHLTFFLLTYLYTLPRQIDEVRARRQAAVATVA